MLVYGDPEFRTGLRPFAAGLLQMIPDAGEKLESARTFLIRAGQLEQALEDAFKETPNPEFERIVSDSRLLTNAAAGAFLAVLHGEAQATDILPPLRRLCEAPDREVRVKVPEGYQFYTLYPEQYAFAAKAFALSGPRGPVLVVGIRSIGTSLSAVVLAVLRHLQIRADRVTVRPLGHPFHRSVELHPNRVYAHALVVDEGPGLSGSSMASVAHSLRDSGIQRITLLPAHSFEPGNAASEMVRQCWENTPRIVVPVEDVQWNGNSLHTKLSRSASALFNEDSETPLQNVGGGQWRELAFAHPAQRPPCTSSLERAKYLWTGNSGRKVLWKFAGLGAAEAPGGSDSANTAVGSLRVQAILNTNGFEAFPWIDGKRPKPSDAMGHLPTLLDYCLQSAGPPLNAHEHQDAIDRLQNVVRTNFAQVPADSLVESARGLIGSPSYGDGRMAPWEWIETAERELLKTDWSGHARDHTIVGAQSVLWDVAGLVVEWNVDERGVGGIVSRLKQAGLIPSRDPLDFFILAYAAFRHGACTICGDFGTSDGNFYKRFSAGILLSASS